MEKVKELEEELEAVPFLNDSDFYASELFKKKVVERKIETLAIEKIAEYSPTELQSNFLKQLGKVKKIENKEVQELILMLDVYVGTVNDNILDYEYDNTLASKGDAVFYNGLLENKEEEESNNFFTESYYPYGYIEKFRFESLNEIYEKEKEDVFRQERLFSEILEVMEEINTGHDMSQRNHDAEMVRITDAANERAKLNFAAVKKQRYIDLEVKIKRMEFLS